MVSLAFVISFVVSAVVLLVGIAIYSDVSDSMIKTFGAPILISNGTGGGVIVSTNLYTCDNPNNGNNQIHHVSEIDGTIISSQNVAVELPFGSGTYSGCVALATDPTDQQMYLVAKSSNALRHLVAINPETGTGTEVAQFKHSQGATGSSIAEIESLNFDTNYFDLSGDLVQVDSDTFLLTYSGSTNDGLLKTFDVSADGLTITEVTTETFDTTFSVQNDLIAVDSDTFLLTYSQGGGGNFLKTFDVSADGTTITEKSSLNYDPLAIGDNSTDTISLERVDSNTFVIAYQGEDQDGFLKTFDVSADGTTITPVATLEHETIFSRYQEIIQVDSDTFLLSFLDSNNENLFRTFTIPSDGSTITQVSTLLYDSWGKSNGESPNAFFSSMVKIDSNTFVIAYLSNAGIPANGDDCCGLLRTFDVSADGTTITLFDPINNNFPTSKQFTGYPNLAPTPFTLSKVNSDTFLIAYSGEPSGDDGFGQIKTYQIPSDGSTINEINGGQFGIRLEHNGAVTTGDHQLVQIDSDTFLMSYFDSSGGYVKTISLTGINKDFIAKTINFDNTGQMYATLSDSEDTWSFLVKVDKTTGFVDTIDEDDSANAYCEYLGYAGGDFGFTTLNYDTGKMFYIDGDSGAVFFGSVTSTPTIGQEQQHSNFHDHADCTEGGVANELESDNFPHILVGSFGINFQMGMTYDTKTGDYFIQDSYEEPQSISRMSGSGVSTEIGTALNDGLQRGMAFALAGGGGGSPPVFESQIPESFAQANNVALTVLGVLPVALFFALFTILSGRVDGGE